MAISAVPARPAPAIMAIIPVVIGIGAIAPAPFDEHPGVIPARRRIIIAGVPAVIVEGRRTATHDIAGRAAGAGGIVFSVADRRAAGGTGNAPYQRARAAIV